MTKNITQRFRHCHHQLLMIQRIEVCSSFMSLMDKDQIFQYHYDD